MPDVTDQKMMAILDQKETNYTPVSTTPGKACSSCMWWRGDSCHIVAGYPEQITPNGYCDEHRVATPLRPMGTQEPIPVVIIEPDEMEASEASRKSIFSRFIDMLLGAKQDEQFTGFKVLDNNRWVGWFTNNFRDREGEIFTEKAIDDYITRVKAGEVAYPELWFWHIKGTKHGQADNLWRLGHFAIATGTFDDTPFAQNLKAYYKTVASEYGMSHGYYYPRSQKRDKAYHQFTTFEISPLRNTAAANDLTYWEIKSMQNIPESVWKELGTAVGEAEMKAIRNAVETRSKDGESQRDWKGLDIPPDVEFEALKKQVGEIAASVKELAEGLATATGMKAVNETLVTLQKSLDAIAQRQTALEKQAADWSDLKPRASRDVSTLADKQETDDFKAMQERLKAAGGKSLLDQMLSVTTVGGQ